MSAKDRTCARCPARIYRDNRTGLCRKCFEARNAERARARMAEEAAAHARLAEGRELEIDRLRRDLAYARSEVTRLTGLLRQWEDRASLEDRAIAEILSFLERNPYRPQLTPRPDPTPAAPGDHQMVAVISDAHYPERVDPRQTFGIRYDAEICRRRLEYLRDKILRYADLRRAAYPVRKITLAVNGDMLSGDIHEELEVTNEFSLSEALTGMAYMLFDFGRAVAEEVEEVEMIITPGNHPRVTKKPRYKQKWNNWETVMGHFVAALAKERFTVTVPKDLVYRHKVFNFTVGISHGDGIKAASFAGIPWYSMKQRQDAIQSLLKSLGQEQLDVLIYGHFHRLIYDEGQGCSLLINGSIKGGDEFSTGIRYQAQAPVQALLTFHPKHGLTDLSRIHLGHIQ